MDVKKLIAAISNKDVVDAFVAALQPAITTTMSELKACIEDLRKEITNKDSVINSLSTEVADLKQENASLLMSLSECHSRLDLVETYTRVDNLVIKGLSEMYAETAAVGASIDNMSANSQQQPQQNQVDENSDCTLSVVSDFCSNVLGIKVQPTDISIAHRIPKGKHDRSRPIMVRFNSRRIRDSIYSARRKLHGSGISGIYINEHLTKHNDHLFAACRNLRKERKIHSTWTWHGITYLKKLQNSRAVKIMNDDDLLKVSN